MVDRYHDVAVGAGHLPHGHVRLYRHDWRAGATREKVFHIAPAAPGAAAMGIGMCGDGRARAAVFQAHVHALALRQPAGGGGDLWPSERDRVAGRWGGPSGPSGPSGPASSDAVDGDDGKVTQAASAAGPRPVAPHRHRLPPPPMDGPHHVLRGRRRSGFHVNESFPLAEIGQVRRRQAS